MSKLKIVLIDDHLDRAEYIARTLKEQAFDVVGCFLSSQTSLLNLESLHADVILLDMDHPERDIVESCVLSSNLPIVLFTKTTDRNTIQQAIEAGVTAYIVDGLEPSKLHTILDIAIEQFKRHQQLQRDLNDTRTKLADRKDIDRAKALLMQLHQIDEQQAYTRLRNHAMRHRITLGEAARHFQEALALIQHLDQEPPCQD